MTVEEFIQAVSMYPQKEIKILTKFQAYAGAKVETDIYKSDGITITDNVYIHTDYIGSK